MALGGHQEALIDAGVVEVVGDGGQQGDHRLHWSQLRADLLLLEEAVHRLGDIRCVHRVVVGIGVVVALFQKIWVERERSLKGVRKKSSKCSTHRSTEGR